MVIRCWRFKHHESKKDSETVDDEEKSKGKDNHSDSKQEKKDDSNIYRFKKENFVPLSEDKDEKLQPPGLPNDVVSETKGKISLEDIIDAISVVITGGEMLLNDPHIDLIDVMNMFLRTQNL